MVAVVAATASSRASLREGSSYIGLEQLRLFTTSRTMLGGAHFGTFFWIILLAAEDTGLVPIGRSCSTFAKQVAKKVQASLRPTED